MIFKYRVLVLNQTGKKIDPNEDIKYWANFAPERYGVGLEVDYYEQNTKLPFSMHKKVKTNANGTTREIWTVDHEDLAPKIQAIVKEGEYDEVIFAFRPQDSETNAGLDVRSTCPYTMIYQQTAFVTLEYSTKDLWKTINHERHHALERRMWHKGIFLRDQMDKTLVEGVWKDYYLDSDIYSLKGNRAATMKSFAPFWEIMFGNINMYKYFRPEEVVNMDPGFVRLLDKARGIAGIPFIITPKGGYRTEEQNTAVGGVDDSAHTKGLAADLRCRDSRERALIVSALFAVGIKRVVVYTKSNHVHTDIDYTKSNPVLTILDK